jgi:hypothetical protein
MPPTPIVAAEAVKPEEPRKRPSLVHSSQEREWEEWEQRAEAARKRG